MLIDCPRLSDADRAAWKRLERFDARLGCSPRLDRLISRGIAHIVHWAADGPGVCSVSWGKDSVVAARLVAMSGLDIPLVWVRSDPWEMPECEQVRDAFLAMHPRVHYEERVAVLRNPKRGQAGHEQHHLDPTSRSQDVLGELITERYISGVRAEESRARAVSIRARGAVTKNTCRPLAKWDATDVFAMAEAHRLPVHPAYAMTFGGRLDRRWLRVHPLGSFHEQSGVHGWDTDQWEDHYYGDVLAAARS